jgi:hypothetical protein
MQNEHGWPNLDWLQPNTNGQSVAQAITSRWWDFQLEALGHSESLIQERWERHKAGTAAAITSTRKICAAGSPAEMVQEYRALFAGTFARTAGEILAANEHFRAAIAAMGIADVQAKTPAPTSPS